MKGINLKVCAVLLGLPVLGCSTVIQPSSYPQVHRYSRVVDAKAALVLSKDFQGYTYKGSPGSLTGALHTYRFKLGAILSDALREGVSFAFTDVTVLDQVPRDASEYDLVIIPMVDTFDFAINNDGTGKAVLFGPLGAAAMGYSSDVVIRLKAEVRDGEGNPFGVFSGDGKGSKTAGTFSWQAADFNESAGTAVSNAVAKLFENVSGAYKGGTVKGAI